MNDTTSSSPMRLGAIAVGVAMAALVLLHMRVDHLVDDAYITFRYSRNFVELGTPVFNAFELAAGGDAVEGYSNFLWMALLGLLHAIGLDLPSVATWVQFGLAAATVVLVGRAATRSLELGAVGAVAAPVLLATSAPFVAWSSGGMETTLFTLLFTWFALAAIRPNEGAAWPVVVAGGLTTITRSDGVLWVLGAAIALLIAARMGSDTERRAVVTKRVALGLGVAIGVALIHTLVRKLVYGDWVPNTTIAKSGGGGDAVARGSKQLAAWGLVTITPIVALIVALPTLRHRAARAKNFGIATVVMLVGFSAYNVAIGGDWMPFFRFLAPLAPVLALFVAIGADALPRNVGVAAAGLTVALQPLALYDVHVAPQSVRESLRFRAFQGGYRTEWERVDVARTNEEFFGNLGRALHESTSPGDVLVFGAIGSTGWFAPKLDFLDRNGLVTPSVARREVKSKAKVTSGHAKRVAHAWFLDPARGEERRPRWYYATMIDGVVRGPGDPSFAGLKQAMRRTGVLSRPPEREMFERTVFRTFPTDDGRTLVLFEPAEPAAATAFWAGS